MSEVTVKKARFVTIESEFEGQRLDNFLLRELKGVPRTYIYRIVRKGEVRVNKGRIQVKYRLQAGDVVRIPPVRQAEEKQGTPHQGLQSKLENAVLYEDKQLIIINKPSGMAVHGGSGISFGVIETMRAMRPEEKYLELAHRLDRDTSGCLILTKRRSALKMIHDLQLRKKIEKKYLALVYGSWGKKTSIKIDVPLKKNTLRGGERIVQVDPLGKEAQTHFSLIERMGDAMLINAILVTGRTHQIRVHMNYAGTPILGDVKYGIDAMNKVYKEKGLNRLFLHAHTLSFRHPETKKLMKFTAPLGDELESVLTQLRSE